MSKSQHSVGGRECWDCSGPYSYACLANGLHHKRPPTTVCGTAAGTRRSTGDTLNMGASAGTGEALAWVIARDVPSTSPNHGYTSGAHGEPWSTHTCGLNIVDTPRAASATGLLDYIRGMVGKTSSCGSHGYGLNGIGMCKGAQYKV